MKMITQSRQHKTLNGVSRPTSAINSMEVVVRGALR
jgi:hypothetical protein